MALLEVEGLTVEFGHAGDRAFRAVDGVSFAIDEGEILGLVGESGSGKSVAMLAVMGLVAFPGRVTAKRLSFAGRDLLAMGPPERRAMMGRDVAMIFQEPMTSLNPCFTVGYQIIESLRVHEGGNPRTWRDRAVELFAKVGIPSPAERLDSYPHQLSGGMNQRVMIAMAIACNPRLLMTTGGTVRSRSGAMFQ